MEGIIESIKVILLMCFCVLVAKEFIDFNYYLECRKSNAIKITAAIFRDWYLLNPQRYNLWDYEVKVETEEYGKYEMIQFTNFIETKKYQRFVRKMEKLKRQNALNESHMKVLSLVQKDIDNARIKAQKNLDEARNVMENVNSRMN